MSTTSLQKKPATNAIRIQHILRHRFEQESYLPALANAFLRFDANGQLVADSAGSAASSLTIAGNGTIGGTFGVTGATTLAAALSGTSAAFSTTLAVTGLSTLTGGLVGGIQALSGAGAVNVTTLTTAVTSTGANALTLANGTAGQVKIITMVVDAGDATLTPTTKTGFTTIVFNDVGDSVILQYHTTLGWIVVSNSGATVA